MLSVNYIVNNSDFRNVFNSQGNTGNANGLHQAAGAGVNVVTRLPQPTGATITDNTLSWTNPAGTDVIVYAFPVGALLNTTTHGTTDVFFHSNNTYFARTQAVRYALVPVGTTSFDLRAGFNPLLPDGNYIIRVQAVNAVGTHNSLLSPILNYTLTRTPLAVPDVSFVAPIWGGQPTAWRSVNVTTVPDATGYNIYVFASAAAAATGNPAYAVAVARNVSNSVVREFASGLTFQNSLNPPGTGQVQFDFRLLQYVELNNSGVIRTLPAGYTPADVGVSTPPGVSTTGNTSNLSPGMYWFRISAVDATGEFGNSAMSPVMDPLSISVGPTEARGMIEQLLAAGAVPGVDFHVLDIRTMPNAGLESANEGIIRFTTWHGGAGGMLGHLGNPSLDPTVDPDIPIFLY